MKKFFHTILKLSKYAAVLIVSIYTLGFSTILAFAYGKTELEHSDAVIVFGAKPYTHAMRERTKEGIEIFNSGLADQIVFSGGKTGDKFAPEAEVMRNLALSMGFTDKVLLESKSRNSYENLLYTKQKIGDPKNIIFVSDCYHIARLYITGKALGYDHITWSCPDSDYYPPRELAYYYFRESIALPWYVATLNFR